MYPGVDRANRIIASFYLISKHVWKDKRYPWVVLVGNGVTALIINVILRRLSARQGHLNRIAN